LELLRVILIDHVSVLCIRLTSILFVVACTLLLLLLLLLLLGGLLCCLLLDEAGLRIGTVMILLILLWTLSRAMIS